MAKWSLVTCLLLVFATTFSVGVDLSIRQNDNYCIVLMFDYISVDYFESGGDSVKKKKKQTFIEKIFFFFFLFIYVL